MSNNFELLDHLNSEIANRNSVLETLLTEKNGEMYHPHPLATQVVFVLGTSSRLTN